MSSSNQTVVCEEVFDEISHPSVEGKKRYIILQIGIL